MRAVDNGVSVYGALLLGVLWTVVQLVYPVWPYAAWINHIEPQMVLHPMRYTE